jgi:penicillin-binding protein 2
MGGGRRLGTGADAQIASRVPVVAALIAVAFATFFGRLFQLQLVLADDLRMRSERNYVRTVRLEAPRGDILDREGRVIATTRPAFGLQVMPNELRHADLTFSALAQLVDSDPADLSERFGAPRGRMRFQPVRLEGDLSYDQRTRIESHLYALPGVITDVRPRRDYVGGSLAAHLLGSIGEIQRSQLETRRYADYRQGEVIGQAGIETTLQDELRGRAGGRNLVVNVAGRVMDQLDEIEPVPGGTAILSIDLDLQEALEAAYAPAVVGGEAKMGAAVALDANTGDVLAMVSKPAYDPNAFAGGIDAEAWKALTEDEWRPLQNRAIAGQYPPGSIYKALVAAAGLEEGLVEPSKKVFCPGSFRLGRRAYRCWKKGGHGWVDLHRALAESCDVYFYRLGLDLGIDRIAFFARAVGLGSRTGVRLPQEQPGLVPTSAWKERRFGEVWLRGETVSASIGQGFNLTTPIQMAVAYAALVNGGNVVRPRLVLETIDPDGGHRPGPAPEVRSTVPIAAKHLERVKRALEGVVHDRGGTGGRARVKGVRVGGKTGTAQVVGLRHTEGLEDHEITLRHRDHAWFVGFAPVESPEIVVAAVVEHGGHGGAAAGPVVQRVLARYFEKKLAPAPVEESEEPVEPPQADSRFARMEAHDARR